MAQIRPLDLSTFSYPLKKTILLVAIAATTWSALPLPIHAEPNSSEAAASLPEISSTNTNASTPPSSNDELALLKEQIKALTQTVSSLQKEVDEQKARWNGFNAPASQVIGGKIETADSSTAGNSGSSSEMEQLRSDVEELKTAQRQVKSGLFNPDISAAVDFITSYSGKANNWNFTLRNVELMVQSNVDQYAKAYIVLNAGSELVPTVRNDIFSDVSPSVEEAAIVTTNLPWGLQLKGGEFFADFTRLGKVHDHDLPFVDRPTSLDQVIGGETRSRGFELNWVPSISHYLRVTGGLVDNIGAGLPITSVLRNPDGTLGDSVFADRPNRPFKSLMEYGRLATLLELSQGAVLHLGADYAQSSQGTRRKIASADAKLEWQPNPAKYDLFETGAELFWTKQVGRFTQAAIFDSSTGSASAAGGYLYAQYRFGKLWQPGVRIDYTRTSTFQLLDCNNDGDAEGLDRFNNHISTYSTYLTLNLSEFNRLRLQLSYLNSSEEIVPGKGHNDLQAFFQWTVILGAHKHDFAP